MKKLRFLISLTTGDNDYQHEQAASATETAARLGVEAQVIYADNDVVTQSQQLLKAIQAGPVSRPDAIIFEPVSGTALPQVARQAVAAKIGWVVLNSDADYLKELRANSSVPAFEVTSDHLEIGRIQGRQLAALLPSGGNILYIQGPTASAAAQQRTAGMQETKPADLQVTLLKAQWTEASGQQSAHSWLRLSTSQRAQLHAVAAQDDSMAMGARKAFEQHFSESERDKWSRLPFLGCDGLPKTGQAWVKKGLLAATVIVPPNTGLAIEKLAEAFHGGQRPAERVLTKPQPFPPLAQLSRTRASGG
jgi:ribose transport system substrate-binding protein